MDKQIKDWMKPQYELPMELSAEDILYLIRYKLEPWEVAEIVGEACHQNPEIRQAIIILAMNLNLEEFEGR